MQYIKIPKLQRKNQISLFSYLNGNVYVTIDENIINRK